MNRRTLFLIAGAVSVAVLYGGDQAYRNWYEQPSERLQSRIEGLQKRLGNAKRAQVAARRDEKKLQEFVEFSLPYDPEKARSAYRAWLLDLVERHEMASASVDAGTPRPIEVDARTRKGKRRVATRLEFTLRAKTDLPHLTAALAEFYQAGHLHKITDMAINPVGAGRDLDVTMSLEALALESCSRESELSDQGWVRLPAQVMDNYTSIARRNIFARGFSRALAGTRLTAITFDRDGVGEAWFRTPDGATRIVAPGDTMPIELFQVEVVDVQAERVYLMLDGQPQWVGLGEPLAATE